MDAINGKMLTGSAVAEILTAMKNNGLDCEELFVPEGVEIIEPGAFMGLKTLKLVHLPKTLRTIGAAAFYGCDQLERIVLPKGLQQIETAAFWGCGLKTVKIPPRLIKLGSEVFANSALQQVEINGIHTGAAMFRGCKNLTKVHINQNVRKIERGMFRDCIKLKSLRMPEKLEQIGPEAFCGCVSLTQLKFPETVKEIGDNAFSGCAFEALHIPQGIDVIRWGTFYACEKLKTIYLPAELKCIESEAFYGCRSLKHLWFGAELKMIQKIQIGDGNETLNKAAIHCGFRKDTKTENE